jgi:hypothetical protein
MKAKKLLVLILFVLIVILAFTNPTVIDFKNHLSMECKCDLSEKNKPYGRNNYFGIFSIYKDSEITDWRYDTYYLGIFKNFIKISEK